MNAKDLRSEPPRRWDERLGGVPWLPRLIDKARAARAGTLGMYLFGQSPMDRACLRVFGLGYRRFAEIVDASSDDHAVLDAILQHDPEALERARRWAQGFERRHAMFLFVLDLDDGYATGPARALRPVAKAVANAASWLAKRLWPAKGLIGGR